MREGARHSSPDSKLLGFWHVMKSMMSRPSGLIGVILVLFHVTIAVISPEIVPYDYKKISNILMLSAPDSSHWLGTDQLGRDVLTRVLMGGRQAIFVTAIATPVAVMWGAFWESIWVWWEAAKMM
jgi:peptide/nickel transport system permease protein